MIRSVFRLVEFSQGLNGELMSKEWYLYVFDSSLMFIVMALFNIWHPSRIFNDKVMEAGKERDMEASGGYMLQNGVEGYGHV
ncbi:hypothetical protein PVAG01_05248 [Phlyctema vagabunda]|uniref:Uncharacterized protein n=1 Tax=Phlyctema vagabunda TaxID=108571 RepID=A0ABR4PKP6_9HELO